MIWIYRIIQFIIGFGEILLSFRLLDFIFEKKFKMKKHAVIVGIVTGVFAILASINREEAMYSWLFTAFLVVLIAGVGRYLYRAKMRSLLFVTALFHILLIIFELLFVFIFGYISQDPAFGNNITFTYSWWRMIVFFLPRVVMLLCYVWIKRMFRDKVEHLMEYKRIFGLMMTIGVFGFLHFQEVYVSDATHSLSVTWVLYFFGTTNLIIFLLFRSVYSSEKERSRFETARADLLEYNYRKVYDSHHNSSIIYHDLKNHLSVLHHYIADKETDKALEYLDNIQEPLIKSDNIRLSDNEIIDFILNYKLAQAQKDKIEVKYDIDVITEMAIGDDELCALLTNLIDNSIEACQFIEEGKRWIDIIIKCVNNMLIVRISNSCKGEPVQIDEKLVSSKDDNEHHGIGVESIRNVVNKYSGIYENQYEDFMFETNITLFY